MFDKEAGPQKLTVSVPESVRCNNHPDQTTDEIKVKTVALTDDEY